MSEKETTPLLQKFIQTIFSGLGIDKSIAKKVLSDPDVKKQISQLKKSTDVVIKNSKKWQELVTEKECKKQKS